MNSFCLPYFPYETLASIQKRIFRERAERREKKDQHTNVLDQKKTQRKSKPT